MADSDVIGGIENLTDAVSGETPSYEYKNPNTDMMKAISKCIDAADGTIGSEYHYDNPNTDVIQKMDELADAIATHSGGSSSIFILNPSMSEEINSVTITDGAFVPYVYRIQDNDSGGRPNFHTSITFGDATSAVIMRNGYRVGCVIIPEKIKAGTYKKLYFECMVVEYFQGTYRHACIDIVSDLSINSGGTPNSILKEIILVDNTKTSEEINSQTGVVINSTDPQLLSAQTVEVDISDITDDFYIGFWNCDRSIYIRSIRVDMT